MTDIVDVQKHGRYITTLDLEDEVFATGRLHLENLDDKVWSLIVDTPDGHQMMLRVIADKNKVRLMLYEHSYDAERMWNIPALTPEQASAPSTSEARP